jgi:hypothetical protein
MDNHFSRRRFLYAAAVFMASSLIALSSVVDARTNYRPLRSQLDLFHAFLQKHPKVATELRRNPRLAYDRRYLARHDELRRFFRRYPAVQREVAERPAYVFARYYGNNRYSWGSPWQYR